MMQIPFFQTDAFTTHPFRGNPAAICLVDHPLDERLMQSIALEMNLSETAFPEPTGPDGTRRLRWFTPTTEVPLCGHATLAAAEVLFAQGEASPIRFSTRSGILTVHREPDGALRMDFPADPPEARPAPQGLLEALGCSGSAVTEVGTKIWVVAVDSEAAVAALRPDFTALGRVDVGGVMGVSVTAPGEDVDFVSRGFFPWSGVDEDPVTGSAHTTLAPFWASRLGRSEMSARQISARSGDLMVRLVDDRVHLVGHAVTVAEGTLFVPE
jgi:PhzF family phenazine biosynthesis protein